MKMKRTGKMSSIFEFPISKLGYMEIFITISLSNFAYLPDENGEEIDVKNKDEDYFGFIYSCNKTFLGSLETNRLDSLRRLIILTHFLTLVSFYTP